MAVFFSYDILVICGTVLEVLAPVSPCHSLVQNCIDILTHLSLKSTCVQYILMFSQYTVFLCLF